MPDEVDAVEGLLDAGARGIKLHLSSDEVDLADPRLEPALAVAESGACRSWCTPGRRWHRCRPRRSAPASAGPDCGWCWPHCALADLGRLHRPVGEVPNLFLDTSWWTPAHLMALFRLVPPARILAASDLPYSTPVNALMSTGRCALQAGLDHAQVASVARRTGDAASSPATSRSTSDRRRREEAREAWPFLEAASTNLLAALEAMQRGLEPEVPAPGRRHACDVPGDDPDAPVLGLGPAACSTSTRSTTSTCPGATRSRRGGTSSRRPLSWRARPLRRCPDCRSSYGTGGSKIVGVRGRSQVAQPTYVVPASTRRRTQRCRRCQRRGRGAGDDHVAGGSSTIRRSNAMDQFYLSDPVTGDG